MDKIPIGETRQEKEQAGNRVDHVKEYDSADDHVMDKTLHAPGGNAFENDMENMKNVIKARGTLLKRETEYHNKCNKENIPLFEEFDAEILCFESTHVRLNEASEDGMDKEVEKGIEVEPEDEEIDAEMALEFAKEREFQQYTTQQQIDAEER